MTTAMEEFVEEKRTNRSRSRHSSGIINEKFRSRNSNKWRLYSRKKKLVETMRRKTNSTRNRKRNRTITKPKHKLTKGLFFAPQVVSSSLKTAIFASKILEELGYNVEPKYNEKRADIVQTIHLGSKEKLIKFCQGIQKGSPIDSNVIPEPGEMGGYEDKVIMAAGTFTEGSTIELSCDGPIREPYIAYMQGGLTYEYGKYGILKAIEEMENNK